MTSECPPRILGRPPSRPYDSQQSFSVRPAVPTDVQSLLRIQAEATDETTPRTRDQILRWLIQCPQNHFVFELEGE